MGVLGRFKDGGGGGRGCEEDEGDDAGEVHCGDGDVGWE